MAGRIASRRMFSTCLVVASLLAGSIVYASAPGFPAAHGRRTGLLRSRGTRITKPSMRGPAGEIVQEPDKPFSLERAQDLVMRIEQLSNQGAGVVDREAAARAVSLIPSFQGALSQYAVGALSGDQIEAMQELETQLENLEGVALNGRHQAAIYRPEDWPARLPDGVVPSSDPKDWHLSPAGVIKVNSGWILDQHLFDPATGVPGNYPTFFRDYRNNDEGQNDMAMGHLDLSTGDGSMFGWVWQVQTFYWSDTTSVTDHPNGSYCIVIMASGDGGTSWFLYEVLYDGTTATHTTSLDMVNPKMAIDITHSTGGYTYDRFYIAYELVVSASNHDVYVFSDNSVLPFYDGTTGGTSDPLTSAIATSAQWEGNPTIAADYKTADATTYRVVAYEYAYSSTDQDLYASQTSGTDSSATWSTPVGVAITTGFESHPALASGGSGGSTFTSYMHLAYNYDTYTTTGAQLLTNPGFESGSSSGWTCRVSTDVNCSGSYQRTGSCCAWLGGIVGYPSWPGDYIYQAVTIPPGVTSSTLSFYLKITTSDSTTDPHDYFYCDVRDTSGNLIQNLVTLSNADVGSFGSYTQLSFDLSKYRGQTVRIYFWSTNDAANATSFFVDDTAINDSIYNTRSEVRYIHATHPGGTPYPNGLSGTKTTVLASRGGTTAYPYGPPAIAASHGGGVSPLLYTGSRILVAADQFFPQDQPTAGDPARYQLNYAVNMCNGGTSCGTITCSPSNLSLNWNSYYFYDNKQDYRFPSLVQDGVGWIGSTGSPQNGVTGAGPTTGYPDYWNSELYLGYYLRPLSSVSTYGDVVIIMTDMSDESCTGFQAGPDYQWYQISASALASDDDGLVVAKQGTLATFNYFYGWPGLCFNKRLNHLGGTFNDDVYFTTLGDDYTVDSTFSGAHIDAHFTFSGSSYSSPWTFAWPAGFQFVVEAPKEVEAGGRSYTFSMWDTGTGAPDLTVNTAYYGPSGQICIFGAGMCQPTSLNALYIGGCFTYPVEVGGVMLTWSGGNVNLTWTPPTQSWDVGQYDIYRSSDCSAASYYTLIGNSATASYQDTTAAGGPYYYVVVAQCGANYGPWGCYGQ